MSKMQSDREARRVVEERRDAAYFRERDAARADGELKSAQLRAMRMAKEATAREQAAAAAAAMPVRTAKSAKT